MDKRIFLLTNVIAYISFFHHFLWRASFYDKFYDVVIYEWHNDLAKTAFYSPVFINGTRWVSVCPSISILQIALDL